MTHFIRPLRLCIHLDIKIGKKKYLNVSNVRNPKKMRLSNAIPNNIFVVDENLKLKRIATISSKEVHEMNPWRLVLPMGQVYFLIPFIQTHVEYISRRRR